jgi:hypothetical protein
MRRFLVLLAATLAVLSCTTSRGSLFQDAADTERDQAAMVQKEREPVQAPEEEQPWEPEYYEESVEQSGATRGLEILSYPDGAEVYLDGRYAGITPLLLPDLSRGRYRLTVTKTGYRSYTALISFFEEHVVYNVALERITGFLRVDVQPPQASVTVGPYSYVPGRVQELPVGRYFVTARAFGFEEVTTGVAIEERELTEISLDLPQAPFAVQDLRADRERFNPRNPGALGSVRVSFRVTSYGSGFVTIVNEEDEEVYRRDFPRFVSWAQELTWNGRGSSGQLAPDGAYRLRLRLVGEREGTVVERELTLRIDSSLVLSFRTLASGSAGLLYAPSPEVLSGGSLQLSSLVLAHWESDGATTRVRVPVVLAGRWGLSGRRAGEYGRAPFQRWELDLQTGTTVGYTTEAGEDSLTLPFFVGAALKSPLLSPRSDVGFALAAQAKLTYQGASTDTLANSSGLSLEPELIISPWRVSYDPSDPREAGFYSWLYARGGLLADLGAVTAGLSLAARTTPFGEPFGVDLPFQAAVELNWLIPRSSLFLSFVFAGEFSPPGAYYLQGGAGLGLLH